MAWATRMACLRRYAPLASTYSSVSGPITLRARAIRARSRPTSEPHDSPILILTRGIFHSSTQRSSWVRVVRSSYVVKPPLP